MDKDIDILVLGSMNMDLVIESERNPYPGETIRGTDFFMNPGGKGNNQAVAIGRLGGNVAFAGIVGDDSYGRELIKNLENNSVKTYGVEISKDSATGLALINIFKGENTIILYEGANGKCIPGNLKNLALLIERSKLLLMQLEIPLQTVEWAARFAGGSNTLVVLNPAPAAALEDSLYKSIDILIPNESEAKLLLGYNSEANINREVLLKRLMDKGIKNVIITLGKEGVIYNLNRDILREAAYKVPVQDSTGAGDAFIGGFCLSFLKTGDLKTSVAYGNKVAAVKLTRKGAQTALPHWNEVEDYFKVFKYEKGW